MRSPVSNRSALRFSVLALLLSFLVAGCSDGGTAPTVASVQLEGSVVPLQVGQTRQFTGSARDAAGNTIQGQALTWTTSNAQVATVTGSGLVTAVNPGTVQVTVAAGGATAFLSFQVVPASVASVSVSPVEATIRVGESRALEATLRDAHGNVLTGRTVTWSSSSSAVATVNASGRVQGVAPGNANITATSDGIAAVAAISVLSLTTPVISSISPSPMREGEEAVITGINFSPASQSNFVRVDGVTTQVLQATSTTLRIMVPSGQCLPEGPLELRVTVAGETSPAFSHSFRPDSVLSMQVGEFRRIASPNNLCFRLPATAADEAYLVGVQSTTPTAATVTPVRFTSRIGTPVAAGVTASPIRSPVRNLLRAPSDRWALHAEAKAALRAMEERSPGSLVSGGTARATAAFSAGRAPARVSGNVQPGDRIGIALPDIRTEGFCDEFVPIETVVRRVGEGAIWLEDVENPEGGFTTQNFEALSAQFDADILPAISSYFGEPTDLDGNGRIVIVVSRQVNRLASGLGFVVSTDFNPECPSTNGGEFYYSRAPDPDGEILKPDGNPAGAYPTATAVADAPILLAHEVTHVIQFGRRVDAGSEFPTVWELEGQATFAEEITGFRVFNRAPGANHGFDVAWNLPIIGDVDWHRHAFTDLAIFYGFQSETQRNPDAPHSCGWLDRNVNGPCLSTRLPYGVAWSFLRWLSDHYGADFPGGEPELMQRLVDNTQRGFATIEAVIGEPMPELLALWAASLWVDERITPLDPRLTHPTWNLRSIDGGLDPTARLLPRSESFVNYVRTFSVSAGSSAYFMLEGGNRPPAGIRARNGSEGVLDDFMQLWIVRIR